jgi:WD40 repeat-containing protein SMU1
MMMDSTVTALALYKDRLLASGSSKGVIMIWNIATGRMMKQFKTAHTQGVNNLLFSANDGERIISASMDFTIKVHGLKSGNCLASLRGHTSFVNTIVEMIGGNIISGSSDGMIKVCLSFLWSVLGCEIWELYQDDFTR